MDEKDLLKKMKEKVDMLDFNFQGVYATFAHALVRAKFGDVIDKETMAKFLIVIENERNLSINDIEEAVNSTYGPQDFVEQVEEMYVNHCE